MKKLLSYTLALPPLTGQGDEQTVKRRFYAMINSVAAPTQDVGVTDQVTISAEEGSQVSCWITNIDDEGNESHSSPVLSWTVVDDIPPAPPGALTVISHVLKPTTEPAPKPAA